MHRTPHPPAPRTVAGLSCCQVLALLSDLLDGELEGRRRWQVEAHLVGCGRCRRAGGEMEALVRQCHHLLEQAPPLDPALHRRLLDRLAAEAERGGSRR